MATKKNPAFSAFPKYAMKPQTSSNHQANLFAGQSSDQRQSENYTYQGNGEHSSRAIALNRPSDNSNFSDDQAKSIKSTKTNKKVSPKTGPGRNAPAPFTFAVKEFLEMKEIKADAKITDDHYTQFKNAYPQEAEATFA